MRKAQARPQKTKLRGSLFYVLDFTVFSAVIRFPFSAIL